MSVPAGIKVNKELVYSLATKFPYTTSDLVREIVDNLVDAQYESENPSLTMKEIKEKNLEKLSHLSGYSIENLRKYIGQTYIIGKVSGIGVDSPNKVLPNGEIQLAELLSDTGRIDYNVTQESVKFTGIGMRVTLIREVLHGNRYPTLKDFSSIVMLGAQDRLDQDATVELLYDKDNNTASYHEVKRAHNFGRETSGFQVMIIGAPPMNVKIIEREVRIRTLPFLQNGGKFTFNEETYGNNMLSNDTLFDPVYKQITDSDKFRILPKEKRDTLIFSQTETVDYVVNNKKVAEITIRMQINSPDFQNMFSSKLSELPYFGGKKLGNRTISGGYIKHGNIYAVYGLSDFGLGKSGGMQREGWFTDYLTYEVSLSKVYDMAYRGLLVTGVKSITGLDPSNPNFKDYYGVLTRMVKKSMEWFKTHHGLDGRPTVNNLSHRGNSDDITDSLNQEIYLESERGVYKKGTSEELVKVVLDSSSQENIKTSRPSVETNGVILKDKTPKPIITQHTSADFYFDKSDNEFVDHLLTVYFTFKQTQK